MKKEKNCEDIVRKDFKDERRDARSWKRVGKLFIFCANDFNRSVHFNFCSFCWNNGENERQTNLVFGVKCEKLLGKPQQK